MLTEEDFQDEVPSSLELKPEELVVVKLVVQGTFQSTTAVNEVTLYSASVLQPLAQSNVSLHFKLPSNLDDVTKARLRLGLAGPNADIDAALATLHVDVNGVEVSASPTMKGPRRVHDSKWHGVAVPTTMAAVEIPLSVSNVLAGRSADSLDVRLSCGSPGQLLLSSAVAVVQVEAMPLQV